MNSKFVADFIVECAKNEIASAEDICAEADIQIKVLNEEIGKMQKLKIKRSDLQSVIRQLSPPKTQEDRQNRLIVDFTTPEEDLTDEKRKMCSRICDYVELNPDKTPLQIIEAIATLLDEEIVFSSIKWLAYHGIIKQVSNGQARIVSKGESWEKRPVNEDN